MTSRNQPFFRRTFLAATLVAAAIAGGVYALQPQRANGEAPLAVAPPAVPVTVQTLVPQETRVWSEFSGRLRAVDAVDIRPEVGGRITAVLFEDGQNVKAGDILFVIDPRPYEAAVARARANLMSAKANAAFTKADADRAAALLSNQTVARRVYDERSNASRIAGAALEAAEAELKQAELNLEHAHVRAPIAGRAGRVEVTLGNLVQPGPGAPLLTTIVADQPIYADFEVDEQTYIESVRDHATGRAAERHIPVEIVVQDDNGRVYRGQIYSFDNRIDVASGTIRARAKLDNTDGALLPGMFVSARLAHAVSKDALLVPERAVGFDQNKTFVYVVDATSKVVYREVKLGAEVQSRRIVLKGVQPGDRVIVDGVQHVRPNVLVAATEAATTNLAQAAVPPAGLLPASAN